MAAKHYRLLLLGLSTAVALSGCEGGGDDDEGKGGAHYQGQSCAQCHGPGFGTIYTTVNAANGITGAADGHTVRIRRYSDNVLLATAGLGRGTGNFNLRGAIADYFLPEVAAPSGATVNRAVTAHSPGSMDCNACHTPQGSLGAPGRIVNYNFNNTPLN